MTETRKNENFTLCTLDSKIINKYEVNTCIQITFFLKKSVTEACLFQSLTFQTTPCQFQVQNVLFVMPSNAVHVKELFCKEHRNQQNWPLIQGHICLPLPPPPTNDPQNCYTIHLCRNHHVRQKQSSCGDHPSRLSWNSSRKCT